MTQRDAELAQRLAWYLGIAAFVGYWWFMASATKRLVGEIAAVGRWFREWREEDRR